MSSATSSHLHFLPLKSHYSFFVPSFLFRFISFQRAVRARRVVSSIFPILFVCLASCSLISFVICQDISCLSEGRTKRQRRLCSSTRGSSRYCCHALFTLFALLTNALARVLGAGAELSSFQRIGQAPTPSNRIPRPSFLIGFVHTFCHLFITTYRRTSAGDKMGGGFVRIDNNK